MSPVFKLASILTLVSIVQAACAPTPPAILHQGPTMEDIYRAHTTGRAQGLHTDRDNLGREASTRTDSGDQALAGYTRDAAKEIHNLFPRLPNPTLCMYVDPHLSREGAGIPGYTTCFPMYETVEYALPGETWR